MKTLKKIGEFILVYLIVSPIGIVIFIPLFLIGILFGSAIKSFIFGLYSVDQIVEGINDK